MHAAPLISTVVFALVLAFVFGLGAQRLRLPPLVGYLLAGIALGPFTPGVVADQGIANQLAEIGIILLMFGVGLHFSLDDLLSVLLAAVDEGTEFQVADSALEPLGLPMSGRPVEGSALSWETPQPTLSTRMAKTVPGSESRTTSASLPGAIYSRLFSL